MIALITWLCILFEFVVFVCTFVLIAIGALAFWFLFSLWLKEWMR